MTPLVPMDNVKALEGAACYFPDPDPQRLGARADTWHPASKQDREGDNATAKSAVYVCREMCPVRTACLRMALDNDEQHGIWGGFDFGDPADKDRARKALRLKRRAA